MKYKAVNKKELDKIAERGEIYRSAAAATSHAIRTSKVMGLSIQSITKDGKLIEQKPNGESIVLKSITKVKSKGAKLKSGQVICLK